MGKVNEQNIYIKNCKIEINGIAHVEKFCKKILLISRKVQQMIIDADTIKSDLNEFDNSSLQKIL